VEWKSKALRLTASGLWFLVGLFVFVIMAKKTENDIENMFTGRSVLDLVALF